MHTLTALMTVIAACQPTPQASLTTAEAGAPPTATQAGSGPNEPAGRRGRAGIDRADGSDSMPSAEATRPKRIPAAELIVTSPPAVVPTVNGGPRSSSAQGAITWLTKIWKPAAGEADAGAYTALLHEDFKGHDAAQSAALARDKWPATRRPALGSDVRWGLPYVTANPNNTGRLSVRMQEAHRGEAGCMFSTRTLNLQPTSPESSRDWSLTSEERSKVTPCPVVTAGDVIGAHTALGMAWRGQDLSAVQKALYGGFLLLDGGVESAQYNHAGLSAGAGRWVLDEVAKTTATASNTEVLGGSAVVTLTSGARLEYRVSGEVWRLTALWRATPQGP
jgi:hypothetical protein